MDAIDKEQRLVAQHTKAPESVRALLHGGLAYSLTANEVGREILVDWPTHLAWLLGYHDAARAIYSTRGVLPAAAALVAAGSQIPPKRQAEVAEKVGSAVKKVARGLDNVSKRHEPLGPMMFGDAGDIDEDEDERQPPAAQDDSSFTKYGRQIGSAALAGSKSLYDRYAPQIGSALTESKESASFLYDQFAAANTGGKQMKDDACAELFYGLNFVFLKDNKTYSDILTENIQQRVYLLGFLQGPVTVTSVPGGDDVTQLLNIQRGGFTLILKLSTDNDEDKHKYDVVAEELKKCDLVNFKTMSVDNRQREYKLDNGEPFEFDRATFMEKLDGNCFTLLQLMEREIPSIRRDLRHSFMSFLVKLLNCLVEHQVTYVDMRLENIGYCRKNSIHFRLIDLDGINSDKITYPLKYSESNKRPMPLFKMHYAFVITALSFCLPEFDATEYDMQMRPKFEDVKSSLIDAANKMGKWEHKQEVLKWIAYVNKGKQSQRSARPNRDRIGKKTKNF